MALATNDFLEIGLKIGGHTKWKTHKESANVQRFKELFGVTPATCSSIWNDMIGANAEDDCHIDNDANPVHFLLAVRFLFRYEREKDLARMFGTAPKTMRPWQRLYVWKLQALLQKKARDTSHLLSLLKRY